jgi:hypothetical protein
VLRLPLLPQNFKTTRTVELVAINVVECPSSRSSRLPPHPLLLPRIMQVCPSSSAVSPSSMLWHDIAVYVIYVGASSAETAPLPEVHVSVSVAPEQGHVPSDVAASPSVLSVAAGGGAAASTVAVAAAASTGYRAVSI